MQATAPRASDIPQDKPRPQPALRLDFLDGLRGLAALYVVLHHIAPREGPAALLNATGWMHFGLLAVAVFIVLSGYCLMLPVARDSEGRLRGGARGFFKRRARRILPPYYAALLLTIVFIGLTGLHKHIAGRSTEDLSVLTPGNLVAHLFLIHNISLQWVQTINPPMWSVATEWQIYFFFPALLLPIWRRWGSAAALLTAFVVGLLPQTLLAAGHNFDWARPWYLGLFALGMFGAEIGFTRRPALARIAARLPWGTISAAFALALCAVHLVPMPAWAIQSWEIDTLAGAATVALIIYCARAATCPDAITAPPILRLLQAPWVVRLGAFSYSLYLMHFPALWSLHPLQRALHLSAPATFAFEALVGVPFALVVAYVFHLLFERRFMPSAAHEKRIPDAAVVSARAT